MLAGRLGIQFQRRLAATDLNYQVEYSQDLTQWRSDADTLEEVAQPGAGRPVLVCALARPWRMDRCSFCECASRSNRDMSRFMTALLSHWSEPAREVKPSTLNPMKPIHCLLLGLPRHGGLRQAGPAAQIAGRVGHGWHAANSRRRPRSRSRPARCVGSNRSGQRSTCWTNSSLARRCSRARWNWGWPISPKCAAAIRTFSLPN